MRYSGISIAYQLGGMIGGAATPIVATALFGAYNSSTPIGIYLTALTLVSLVAALGLRGGDRRGHRPGGRVTTGFGWRTLLIGCLGPGGDSVDNFERAQ